MCHRAKFQNWPSGFGDITIFLFSRWPPFAILDFQIFKHLVNHHVGRLNIYASPNQITPKLITVAEISHLIIFKLAAVRHVGFS